MHSSKITLPADTRHPVFTDEKIIYLQIQVYEKELQHPAIWTLHRSQKGLHNMCR